MVKNSYFGILKKKKLFFQKKKGGSLTILLPNRLQMHKFNEIWDHKIRSQSFCKSVSFSSQRRE